jgi:uncharacterized membrane protein
LTFDTTIGRVRVGKKLYMEHETKKVIHPKKSNQNLIAVVIYLLDILGLVGILVSLIFLFFQKKNDFIRFHAAQSLITFLSIFILGLLFAYIPGVSKLLQILLGLFELGLWILLMVKAYKNVKYKLPYIGDLAEGLLKKIG